MMETKLVAILLGGDIYKGKYLAKEIGIGEGTVRAIVNGLRSSGIPVCSCREGYYLTDDADELRKTIHSLERRIKLMTYAVNGLKAALEQMGDEE